MIDFNMIEVGDNTSQELNVNYIHEGINEGINEGIVCFIVFIAFLRFWIF